MLVDHSKKEYDDKSDRCLGNCLYHTQFNLSD